MAKTYNIKGKEVLLSDEDSHLFDNLKLHLIPARQLTEKYYVATFLKSGIAYLHRIVMGAEKGEVVDHINKNPLDCRRENLRIVSQTENRYNCTVRQNKTGSTFKGVFFDKRKVSKPFYSCIRKKGEKAIYCGSFTTELEAAQAYERKLKELGLAA